MNKDARCNASQECRFVIGNGIAVALVRGIPAATESDQLIYGAHWQRDTSGLALAQNGLCEINDQTLPSASDRIVRSSCLSKSITMGAAAQGWSPMMVVGQEGVMGIKTYEGATPPQSGWYVPMWPITKQ